MLKSEVSEVQILTHAYIIQRPYQLIELSSRGQCHYILIVSNYVCHEFNVNFQLLL